MPIFVCTKSWVFGRTNYEVYFNEICKVLVFSLRDLRSKKQYKWVVVLRVYRINKFVFH